MEWPILTELSERDRREVLRICSKRHVKQGEFACLEGDKGDRLFLLESGHAIVEVVTKTGTVSTFAVLGPGEVFGEQALISGTDRRGAAVRALEPLELLYLTRYDFERLRVAHPELNRFLFVIISARMKDLTTQLLEALYCTAEQRVFSWLLRLAAVYGDTNSPSVRISLTQDQIASLAGTTRPTANRVLKDAARAGAIRLGRGYLVVKDGTLLGKLAAEADSHG